MREGWWMFNYLPLDSLSAQFPHLLRYLLVMLRSLLALCAHDQQPLGPIRLAKVLIFLTFPEIKPAECFTFQTVIFYLNTLYFEMPGKIYIHFLKLPPCSATRKTPWTCHIKFRTSWEKYVTAKSRELVATTEFDIFSNHSSLFSCKYSILMFKLKPINLF